MKAPTPETRVPLAQGAYLAAEEALLAALAERSGDATLQLEAVELYHTLNEPERAASHLGQAREQVDPRDRTAVLAVRLAEACDHLAHRHVRPAAEIAAEVARQAEAAGHGDLELQALVLGAEAELMLENHFRSFRLAEKALGLKVAGNRPELRGRALLALARYYDSKDNTERFEEISRQALALARAEKLAPLEAELLAFTGERELRLSGTAEGSRRAELLASARSRIGQAAETLNRLAAELPEPRRRAYLAQPRRAALVRSALELMGARTPGPAAGSDSHRLVTTLSEITGLINSMQALDSLLERVMDVALAIVGAERGLVVLLEPDVEHMTVRVARNVEGHIMPGLQEFSRTVVRQVAGGREIIAVDAAGDDWMSRQHSVAAFSIRSIVCFPLRGKDGILGAVYLDNQKQMNRYGEADLEFLRAFTNLAAIAIEKSRWMESLREENVFLKRVAAERFKSTNIIGSGPLMEKVFHLVERAMDTTFPVLVTGETGTGKEVITKAIHFGGNRKDRPFVAQNCAAIPSELLESEMFGYKRGAFTGAEHDKKGLFEIASGGTLFLDEIGDLDLTLQAKLLRVLQDGLIRRVGETAERRVDVRIIAATNRDLREAVNSGSFRLDLFYRLNVLQIDLPPLRERPEDIPQFAQLFLDKCNKQMSRNLRGFTSRAMERLVRYPWPGNVRELENAVARAVVFAEGEVIDLESLPAFLSEARGRDGEAPSRDGREPSAGAAEPRAADAHLRARAAALVERIELGEQTFWDAVKRPFLERNLARDLVREVIRLGLEKSDWKYTRALRAFRLPDEEYRRFMNFLAKFDLKVDRPQEPL